MECRITSQTLVLVLVRRLQTKSLSVVFPQPADEEEGGERPAEDRAAVGGAGRLEGVHADQQHVGHSLTSCLEERLSPRNLFGYRT